MGTAVAPCLALSELMQNPSWNALMRSESVLLARRLAVPADASVVVVEAPSLTPVDSTARLVCRLRLRSSRQLGGDALAYVTAWPMASQEVDVVVLRHVLELVDDPQAVLHEAARVLAPGGQLWLTGVHPCSLWHARVRRRARASGLSYRARMPMRLESWLRGAQLVVGPGLRYGSSLPLAGQDRTGGLLAACYLLNARRSSNLVTPLRLRPRTRVVSQGVMGTSLVGAARRQRAG